MSGLLPTRERIASPTWNRAETMEVCQNHVVKSGSGHVTGEGYNKNKPIRENGNARAQDPVVCFNCNRPRHIAKKCTKRGKPLVVCMVGGGPQEGMLRSVNLAPAKVNGCDATV